MKNILKIPLILKDMRLNNLGGFLQTLKGRLYSTYIFTFIALICILFFGSYFAIRTLLIEQIGNTRVDVLRQIGERSNSIKNSSRTISNLYYFDSVLKEALQKEKENIDEEKLINYLDNLQKNYSEVFQEIGLTFDVVIIGKNGFNYSSCGPYDFEGLAKQLWYKQIYEKEGDITFISSFLDKFSKRNPERYVFSISRMILDNMGKEIGTLMIHIDEAYLAELYSSTLNGENSIYIIDKKGNIITHNNKEMRGLNFIDLNNFKRLYGENTFNLYKQSRGEYLSYTFVV